MKTSERNCRFQPSLSWKDLVSDKSSDASLGPISVFRPRLPRWLTGGSSNALMSQYRPGPPRTGLPENSGFIFGLSLREMPLLFKLPDRLNPN